MTMHILHLRGYSIIDQLRLEEALLRTDTRNWCLINEGSPPAIVLGISSKVEELVDMQKAKEAGLPLIKRFSGGGTVVVDQNTLFVTFIFQKEAHTFPAYPEPIMQWSGEFYRELFPNTPFQLRENDYVWEERKCGGNAQYIQKERWLHHTSFLWDYDSANMGCLLHPKKTPPYRQGRTHEEFLCRLSEYHPSKDSLITSLKELLAKRYTAFELRLEDAIPVLQTPHRQATTLLS